MINRRDLFGMGLSATTAAALVSGIAKAADSDRQALRIVDTNVSLFEWPFRSLPLDQTSALVLKLRSLGIAQAWASSFEGLLHRDVASVNRRLAEACAGQAELTAIGTINPTLPGWEDDLSRCVQDHQMPGVRLFPNYHDYTLDDRRFISLLTRASDARLFVQIAVAMEDTRTQHKRVRARDVDLAPLGNVMARVEGARVQLLNAKPRVAEVPMLAKIPRLFFDTSRIDATDGVPGLVGRLPFGRVLFGSHAPLLVPEAALIRVHESGKLDNDGLSDVLARNAQRFLQEND